MPTINKPFVLRIRHGRSREANVAHAKYIATREGVDLETEMKSFDTDQDLSIHAQYMDERPRSEGLFGPDPHAPPDLDAVKSIMRHHDGHVWQGVFSLAEEDAVTLGYGDGQQWRDLTRRSLARLAEEGMGLRPGEYHWVAAHHREPGHPHVHFLMWQDDAAPRRRAMLSKDELRKARQAVSKEVYGPLRTQITMEKTIMRDLIVAEARDTIRPSEKTADRVEQTLEKAERELVATGRLEKDVLAPTSWPAIDVAELNDKLTALSQKMPGKGRAALAFMPEEVKREARDIADWVLSRPSLAKVRHQWEQSVDDLTSLYSSQPKRLQEAREKAYADLRDRVAQSVIQRAGDMDRTAKLGQLHVRQNVKSVFQSAFQAIQGEHLKAQAQAEVAKRRAVQQSAAEQRRDNERGW
ncbi:MAG: relaxase MobL [Alicyclobacillus sp.]|nr:relaxase MobL [Alicyclobacillus sp.]